MTQNNGNKKNSIRNHENVYNVHESVLRDSGRENRVRLELAQQLGHEGIGVIIPNFR